MRVKLTWYTIKYDDLAKLKPLNWGMDLLEAIGSNPRTAGMNVEGMIVPAGECWLFDNGTDKLKKLLQRENIAAEFHSKYVNI